jgi:hypothetical protein
MIERTHVELATTDDPSRILPIIRNSKRRIRREVAEVAKRQRWAKLLRSGSRLRREIEADLTKRSKILRGEIDALRSLETDLMRSGYSIERR